jgi:hypothetical protein
MAAENIAAGTQADWQRELERSRRSGVRLLDSLARKMEVVRAPSPAEARTAPRGPIYAVAAALAAGLLIGIVLKRSGR